MSVIDLPPKIAVASESRRWGSCSVISAEADSDETGTATSYPVIDAHQTGGQGWLELDRRSGVIRDPDKIRAWQLRSRKPLRRSQLRSVSRKRQQAGTTRKQVREAVWWRSGGVCEYVNIIPEVRCGMLPDRGMEVDELRGGSHRSREWLDPDQCRLTCPVHHDWKTTHKREILRRLNIEGY